MELHFVARQMTLEEQAFDQEIEDVGRLEWHGELVVNLGEIDSPQMDLPRLYFHLGFENMIVYKSQRLGYIILIRFSNPKWKDNHSRKSQMEGIYIYIKGHIRA